MTFEAVLKAIQGCSAFDELDSAQRGQLLLLAKPRRVTKGELLFRKGDAQTDTFVLVVSGAFDVLANQPGEPVIHKEAGELLGEMGRFTKAKTRTRSVQAKTDVDLLEWSFGAIETANPRILDALVKRLEEMAFERMAQDI